MNVHRSVSAMRMRYRLKITKMGNECKQVYTCECRREVKISGTILDLYYRKTGSEKDQDWIQAELWRVRG